MTPVGVSPAPADRRAGRAGGWRYGRRMSETAGDLDQIDHESDQLEPTDTLDDRGVDDVLDEGYSPAERPWIGDGWGTTAREEAEGESLDARLARELPDERRRATRATAWGTAPTPTASCSTTRSATPGPAGWSAADEGGVPDTDEELYAVDIGIDGAGASAEEAAVHVVTEESPLDDD